MLCTHRPVLPAVFDALGLDDPQLDPGGMLVVHHRKGRVVATEQHQIPLSSRRLVSASGRVHVIAVSLRRPASTTGRFEFTPRSPTAAGPVTCAP